MSNSSFGNAFIISTPKSDRVVQSVNANYANEQRQRALNEQRNMQLLDQEYSKNASQMRDIDIPILTKKYAEYKAIKQDLYRNGSKMSSDERIKKQLVAQGILGEGLSVVAKSKELKAPEDDMQKMYIKNPYGFDENSANVLMQSRNTPVTMHPGIDGLVDGVQLKTQDFSKNVAAAVGKQSKVGVDVRVNGVENVPTDYFAYNSPSQFANTLSESIPDKRSQNKFINQHSYNDLAAQDLIQRYNAIKATPAFKKAYPNEPEISTEALNDPFKKAVTLTAIDHILRHPPTAIEGKPYKDANRTMEAQNEEWTRRLGIKDAQWLRHNKITYNQSLNKIRVNNDKTGVYEVDDVPGLLLKDSSYMDIPFFGRSKVVDISKLPEGYRQDILGTKDSRGMQRSGYMVDGKELLVVSPDGQFVGEGFTVNPKDIQLSTMKRTAPLEKPIGTNKAKLRNEESGDKKESTAPATSRWDKYKKN